MVEPTANVASESQSRWHRWWPAAIGASMGLILRLLFSGDHGEAFEVMMVSYVLLGPIAVAAVAVYLSERTARRTWGDYFVTGMVANLLLILGTVALLIEGFICAILAVPILGIVGGFAGVITGALCRWLMKPVRAVYCAAALPLLGGAFEQHVPLPVEIDQSVRTRIIDASAQDVWSALTIADGIRPDEMRAAWAYRVGVPLPLSAVTQEIDGERVRHIEMDKGIRFDQVALEWQPDRRVVWGYRFAPDSFPPLDDHVRIGGDYFDLVSTEYALEPVGGKTRLTTVMTYRISTHFNWYARLVAKAFIGNFEETALDFYARRAEQSAEAGSIALVERTR